MKTLHQIRTLKLLIVKNGRNIAQTFLVILTKGIKPLPKTSQKRKISKDNSTFLNELTNPQEIRKILKKLKPGKSPGLDRISNEMIQCSFEILKNCFVKLFNLNLTVGYILNIWCKGLITPAHKNGDPTEPDNFRPICVLRCVCKFFTNVLNNRLTLVCKKEKLIHCSQIGFLENYRTTDHIFSLKTLLNKYTRGVRNGKVYSSFIDFKKAYDSVWHEGMYAKLESLNNKKRSHTQLNSRKQVIAFQDRVITINIKEAQHPLK